MYKSGDIVVCSNKTGGLGLGKGFDFELTEGEKYEVIESIPIHRSGTDMGPKHGLNVRSLVTGKEHILIPETCFIPLEVYREFQLTKILKKKKK